MFVGSLAFCAVSYFLMWSRADGGGWTALAFNALLVSIFAAHHSIFARENVKSWLVRRVPERLLRSVYVWTASLLLLGTCAAWRPIGRELFHTTGVGSWFHAAVQLLGIWMIARAVRGLDPLELAGIRQSPVDSRQSTVNSRQSTVGRGLTADDRRLTTDGPYRLVRHPLYLGWILLVFGAAHMTGDRVAFAALTTAYLLIAIPWEERSLVQSWGDQYLRYQRLVRWRVIPFIY